MSLPRLAAAAGMRTVSFIFLKSFMSTSCKGRHAAGQLAARTLAVRGAQGGQQGWAAGGWEAGRTLSSGRSLAMRSAMSALSSPPYSSVVGVPDIALG